ncbi:hypothetical protein BGZ57DRAFT_235432 [Hyaloscypha finlandica]|nr:hypothetical protein BGZ57DRAFT_235432 [Hyaloscypha finlandica]
MTLCGDYTYFCCGQDDAARSCCTSRNGTVLLAAGTAILPTATVTYNNTITATTSPTGCSLDNSTTASNINQSAKSTVPVGAVAGLGVVSGVALIILAVLVVMWRKKAHRANEAEPCVSLFCAYRYPSPTRCARRIVGGKRRTITAINAQNKLLPCTSCDLA